MTELDRASRRIRLKPRVAAAAAVVLVIAGGVVLAVVRPDGAADKSAAPTAATALTAATGASAEPAVSYDYQTHDWGWRQVSEPAPGPIGRVAKGYLGECVSDGLPAACTSQDGVKWAVPADPTMFGVAGPGPFGGWSLAHADAGWVASGTIDPGAWRSADGINWSPVSLDLPGLQRAKVQALATGFAMIAQTYDGKVSATSVLTSAAGTTWSPQVLPDGLGGVAPAGAIGLVGQTSHDVKGSPVTETMVSADGISWRKITLPAGLTTLSSSVRLPDDTYVGLGSGGAFYVSMILLTSRDGMTWQAQAGPGPGLTSLAPIGDRILAISRIQGSSLVALWESSDATAWQQVTVLTGSPLDATQVVSLGDRVGLYAGSKLTMIGVSTPGAKPSPAPLSSASLGPGSPSTSPSDGGFDVGGWRWHTLNRLPDGGVGSASTATRLPGGYLGRCGASMCTSANGWSWQSPPDPAIFSADSTAVFTPMQIAHRQRGGYVIMAVEGVWYSADGLHWQLSNPPDEPHGFQGLLATPTGFALIGQPDDAVASRCTLFVSTDGLTWSDAGLIPALFLNVGHNPDTSGGLVAALGVNPNKHVYSTDGRNWAAMTTPADASIIDQPSRLADGSLVMLDYGGYSVLRSPDGRVWTRIKTGWQVGSLAVGGGRIVVAQTGSEPKGAAWESSNDGKSFHELVDNAGSVSQFGDQVLVGLTHGGYYVGAPIAPSESPGASASAGTLPSGTPAPRPTPQAPPAGGIAKAEALRIAINAAHPTADQASKATAAAETDLRSGRWIWQVTFVESYEGPLAAQGTFVDVDYFTGDALNVGTWIS